VLTRNDAGVDFVWDNVAPARGLDPHVFSIRWTGQLSAPESGNYVFRAHVDDGIRVWVNNQLVIDAWDMHDSEAFTGKINLVGGRQYNLKVEYFNALLEGEIQLFWQLPSEAPIFKGMLGYNDHPIDGKYFSLPPQPAVSAAPAPAKEVPAPKKKVVRPLTPAKKPAVIAADTLEKYLPKNVLFVKSKSVILPESAPELDQLAGFLVRNPRYRLLIEGHTDHIGNAEKNLALSKERAQTVADYLSQKGVAATRIIAKGYGDTRPLVREQDGVPNPKNRRVEFTIMD
jgi:outer membrane protein OmpA-like peptidoglycan-associated protein